MVDFSMYNIFEKKPSVFIKKIIITIFWKIAGVCIKFKDAIFLTILVINIEEFILFHGFLKIIISPK